MNSLCLDIYHYKIKIESNHEELLSKLRMDFSQYISLPSEENLKITIKYQTAPQELRQLPYKNVFKNSLHYDYLKFRVLNYENSVFVIFNYLLNQATIYGELTERVHEVTYLLILSRMGKHFDLHSRHRIHAAAFEMNGTLYVLPMASGVGKSSLVLEALKRETTRLYSDDSPLVAETGEIWPLHFRIGVTEKDREKLAVYSANYIYSLKRKEFGLKWLLDVEAIAAQLEQKPWGKKVVIVFGTRTSKLKRPTVDRIGRVRAFSLLVLPMLVGYGLPVLLEYFWESGFKDFGLKIKIALSRIRSAWRFIDKNDSYYINFTDIPAENLSVLEGL